MNINDFLIGLFSESNLILVDRAKYLAGIAHANQFRKDGITPYFVHPCRVANLVEKYVNHTPEMVAAAYMHDVLEDTDVTSHTLQMLFHTNVVNLVLELTNPSKGLILPRKERKEIDRQHLFNISKEAKIIKLFDRLDNIQDLTGFSNSFTALYMKETLLMLDVIEDADKNFTNLIRRKTKTILQTVEKTL